MELSICFFLLMFLYLGCGNAVHKADLLKSFLTHGEANLPPIIHSFIHHLQGHTSLIQFVLHIQIHIAAEACNLTGQRGHRRLLIFTCYTN